MKTKERLAAALREVGAPEHLVELALDGRFDDFESESPQPIHDLVAMVRGADLPTIVARAMSGEFDATKEEADAWAAAQTDPEMIAALEAMKVTTLTNTGGVQVNALHGSSVDVTVTKRWEN